ncbi:exporting protein, partial [Campylobacter lari]
LVPDYKNPHIDRARLILEFSDFKKDEAVFIVYIEDRDKKLEVKFLDPRKPPLN